MTYIFWELNSVAGFPCPNSFGGFFDLIPRPINLSYVNWTLPTNF